MMGIGMEMMGIVGRVVMGMRMGMVRRAEEQKNRRAGEKKGIESPDIKMTQHALSI